jgi:hypothetical protein
MDGGEGGRVEKGRVQSTGRVRRKSPVTFLETYIFLKNI